MPRAGSRPVALAIALLLTMGLLLSVTPAAAQPGTMCEVITIAELDGLSPLTYDSATADFTGCAYAPADATHSLRIGLAPLGEVKSMPEVFPLGSRQDARVPPGRQTRNGAGSSSPSDRCNRTRRRPRSASPSPVQPS